MVTSKKKAKKRAEDSILNKVAHWLELRVLARREPVNAKRVAMADAKLIELSDQYFELTGHRIPVD